MAGVLKTLATDGMGDGAYLFGDYDMQRSAEQIMLAAKATVYQAATVLGKVTATGVYKPLDPAANDGTQNFGAILYGRRPANAAAAQRAAGTVREASVNGNALIYEIAVSGPQKAAVEAQMAAAGVIVRY